jgi:hypothetical protein
METDDLYLLGGRGEARQISVSGDLGVSRLLLDIHCVKGLLLACDKEFLGTFYDKISTLVLRTLACLL